MQYEPSYYLQKYKKKILLWGVVLLVCVSVVGFAMLQQVIELRKGKIAVPIHVVPHDASIEIDGQKYTPGTQYLAPGDYTARIIKDGFHTTTQQLRVNDYSHPVLYAGLAPASEEAKQWQRRNNHQYAKLERLSFEQSQKYGQEFQKRWPIVQSLPIKDPYFTIGYKNINDRDIILTIKGTSPRYRELAIDELRKKGFEPTDYRIEFIGFNNPLKGDS